jgi:ribose transport system permease protein
MRWKDSWTLMNDAQTAGDRSPNVTEGEFSGDGAGSFSSRLISGFSPKRIGAIYILILIGICFSIFVPSFAEMATVRQILNGNAVAALAALALLLPLSAGIFDLSIAANMTFTGVLCAQLTGISGYPIGIAVLLTLAAALGVGMMNGIVVVLMRIDSFIGTLATGSLITALVTIITNENVVSSIRLAGPFSKIAQTKVNGFTLPILYAVVIALVIWHVQERTATGRRLYAIGFNRDAARLGGVHNEPLRFMTLLVSAFLSGVAGIVLASSISSGSPTAGTPYLLTAFSAAFLGATQFKEGRFNAWGTIVGVLLLGTGTVGLGLAGAALWAQSLFTGVVLIAALAVTSYERRAAGTGFRGRLPGWPGAGAATAENSETNRPESGPGSDNRR